MADLHRLLLDHALGYPEAWEDHLWGDTVVKVRRKIFVFLSDPDSPNVGCSVKLPESGMFVLTEKFAEPTGYGLGKSGWVSLSFEASDDHVPVDLLRDLIDESYRAIAPKTLVKQLDTDEDATA
jgi:predicted DNA-binding protein (MmcQ/YjbR family)